MINKIFGSIEITNQTIFEENLKKLSLFFIRRYCKLLSLDVDEFCKEISYSYWEKIGGLNRSIVADSAIPGRYHIFTTDKVSTDRKFLHNYSILDNGKIILNGPSPMTDELKTGIGEVIEFYEKIRNMEGFNPKHCPLVEFQTHEEKNYFLQYHRTQDIELSTWKLERCLEEGEFEAAFVRGMTVPEGIILNVAMYYPDEIILTEDIEEGSFDFHYNHIFSEIMSRKRIANFDNKSLYKLVFFSIDAHLPKSKLFNPQIFVSIPDNNLPTDLHGKLYEQTRETQKPARVKIRVVSDGRKAYVKFFE